jgi:DNA-binding PadR family transcriptional regulator
MVRTPREKIRLKGQQRLSKITKARGTDRTQSTDGSSSLDLFSGDFIRLHVLHHASEQPVYGLWLIEELAEHGYRVSPGTLYPLLHSLEESELLKSYNEVHEGKIRRYYKITSGGRKQLKKAKLQLIELMREILTKDDAELLATSFVSRE